VLIFGAIESYIPYVKYLLCMFVGTYEIQVQFVAQFHFLCILNCSSTATHLSCGLGGGCSHVRNGGASPTVK